MGQLKEIISAQVDYLLVDTGYFLPGLLSIIGTFLFRT